MAIICSYIASPTHWRAYLHHCTQLSRVVIDHSRAVLASSACVSQVNSRSRFRRTAGRPFSKISGVRGFPDILPESWHSLLFASILTNAGGKSVGMPTKTEILRVRPVDNIRKMCHDEQKRRLLLCVLEGLQPAAALGFFLRRCAPSRMARATQSDLGLSGSLRAERGLSWQQDARTSSSASLPAPQEDHPTVILQGHFDMVCEKLMRTVTSIFRRTACACAMTTPIFLPTAPTLGGDDYRRGLCAGGAIQAS